MEAVLAMHALERLEERTQDRLRTAAAIQDVLDQAGFVSARASSEAPDVRPAWFDVALILPPEWASYRDWLIQALNAENIPVSTYPSLIEMPWVKPWMMSQGWWGDREEQVLAHERSVWGRVIVIGTQMSPEDGRRCAEGIVAVLTGARIGEEVFA
jgi:dTDP-4-amino-4,6-dideoxygalactose transaminase